MLFIDICGVDYLGCVCCFDVVYYFFSLCQNQCIRIKLSIDEEIFVLSVLDVFFVVNWFECEVFDMYGVLFLNYLDLWCILIDYGFEGYFLCKDFLFIGYVEVWYDEE